MGVQLSDIASVYEDAVAEVEREADPSASLVVEIDVRRATPSAPVTAAPEASLGEDVRAWLAAQGTVDGSRRAWELGHALTLEATARGRPAGFAGAVVGRHASG